jgi:hypothetical protein
VYVDDRLLIGPVASSLRPNSFWLGGGGFLHWTTSDWSDLTIDRLSVWVPEGDDPQDFQFQPGGGLSHGPFSLDHDSDPTLSHERVLTDIPPGSGYSVQETVPVGWEVIAEGCDHGNTTGGISIASGELVTCTFTNLKRGRLVVRKDAQPNDAQDFDFRLTERATSFSDDFTGSSLDPQKWNTTIATSGIRYCADGVGLPNIGTGVWDDPPCPQNPSAVDSGPFGSITLADGEATFARGCCTRGFPYVWHGPPSLPSPFPASGDFVLEVRMKWNPGVFQTAFFVNNWPDTSPQGNSNPGQGQVFQVRHGAVNLLGGADISYTSPTSFHTHRLEYVNGMYSVFIDGVLRAGPTSSAVRPNDIWMGNPIFAHYVPPNDWNDFTLDYVKVYGTQSSNFQLDDDGGGDSTLSDVTTLHLYPKTGYSLDETVPAGWDLDATKCDPGNSPAAINLKPGETIDCKFTNQKRGSLVVRKDAQPNDPQNFNFSFTPPGGSATNFQLDDDSDPTLSNEQVFTNLEARGGYSIAETSVPSGWDAYTNCSSGEQPNNITIEPGEQVICTITNKRRGTIVVVKDAFPNETTDFTFDTCNPVPSCATPVGLVQTFQLDDDPPDGTLSNSRTFTNVLARNDIIITERSNIDFAVGVSCDDQNSATPSFDNIPVRGATINLDPGETVTCTYVNTGVYPRPGGAAQVRLPLVPAFAQCTTATQSSNHVGPPPYDTDSCSPVQLESNLLTTSNTGRGRGNVRMDVINGNTSTPADEANVSIFVDVQDVVRQSDGADYTGKLILATVFRITDRSNSPINEGSGTVEDVRFAAPIDCAATPDPATGGRCTLTTTADALAPNVIRELHRSILSILDLSIEDAGPDGSVTPPSGACPYMCGSGDESVFARPGMFAP